MSNLIGLLDVCDSGAYNMACNIYFCTLLMRIILKTYKTVHDYTFLFSSVCTVSVVNKYMQLFMYNKLQKSIQNNTLLW